MDTKNRQAKVLPKMQESLLEQRAKKFWSQVDKTESCWNWKRGLRNGYGAPWFKGRKSEYAHRISYELLVGKIPKGMEIDHLCRNRACCNPSHLEVVSAKENTLRGIGITAINSKKTKCINGHLFTLINTYKYKTKDGFIKRYCRVCNRLSGRRYYANSN